MFSNQNQQKISSKFYCIFCDYYTNRKSNYDEHLLSRKHQQSIISNQNQQKISKKQQPIMSKFYCHNCSKIYKDNSGLWRHKKKCLIENQDGYDEQKSVSECNLDEYSIDPCSLSDKDLIMLLISENKEFKQIVMDQHKTIIELSKTGCNHNTTHHSHSQSHNNHSLNKTFNLQFFLNEQCKDAMNLSEFVTSVTMELSDLEETGRLGYVEGVSRIINKNLNKLDVYKRPIHCSDLKRETLYIKNDDEWKKEGDGKSVIIKAIKDVANENIKQIGEWRKQHPGCSEADSNKNDFYLKIVSNAMSGSTREEQMTNYEKIVSKIAKEVVIVK